MVEYHLAKVAVAGSSPVARSNFLTARLIRGWNGNRYFKPPGAYIGCPHGAAV